MPEPPKRYSLSGSPNAKPAVPMRPAAAPVNTSTFLTRIANNAIRETTAPQQAATPKWVGTSSIDHSSPAANLNSRLKWVETAFRNEGAPAQMMPAQTRAVQQAHSAPPALLAGAGDFKTGIELMRKRMAVIKMEIDALDKELAEVQAKIEQKMAQQGGQQ